MYNYRRDGITIAAVLDNRTKRADGNYPVRIRVNHNRVRKYLPTGKNLTQEEWDNLSNTRNRTLSDIRKSIEESFYVVKENIDALCQKGDFSFSSLDTRLGNGSGESVNKVLEAKIKQLDAEGRIGTKDLNQNTLFILEEFGGRNIPFDIITVAWLKRCEAFWTKTKNTTSIGMHMRNLRAIMNEAKRTGVIKDSQYPFGRGKYEIKTGDSIKKALSIDHIKQIYHFTHFSETLLKYRDLWLFIYFCNGLNVADMVKLKYSDIIDDEICFVRQKTCRTTKNIKRIRVPLNDDLQNVISKWGNPPSVNSYIFPYLNGIETPNQQKVRTRDIIKRINKYMNLVARELGIKDNITTYTARHSYATTLKRSGANIAYISESLGHNDLSTTEHYLASFEREEREKNAQLLTQFL
ncbi:integrase-like protein [Dysgonomonas alginatilytica]|uniref:Integrase-like protein n=1 Tax=Dysgonomonas alginatilytica TaxID=1605892 RepID=A0A2V3PM53_9BACT|nr:site-specific integrase [Dysgonomonas alginatilytica]PXV62875.1 integrase-like protein [Dysgonomonas alginatilytica]